MRAKQAVFVANRAGFRGNLESCTQFYEGKWAFGLAHLCAKLGKARRAFGGRPRADKIAFKY